MPASLPAQLGDGNGEIMAATDGAAAQAALDQALDGDGRRAALLVVEHAQPSDQQRAFERLLRTSDMVLKLTDGRHAILAPHLRETGGAADLAARLLAAMPDSRAAVGIALAPGDGRDWPGLLRVAEGAAQRANVYARGRFAFRNAELDARWRIGPLLASAIAEALAEGQYSLAYQPIARLADGAVVGAEALLRWRRPGGESWPPAIFIPEAERRGLIEPITGWTLRAACQALAALNLDDATPFRLGVNLSAAMLGAGAVDMATDILARTGVDPKRLTIEITETAPFIDDPKACADAAALAALGCGLAIDDFGAGHASLAYVVRLPATRIKLDASLTQAFAENPRARAAIAATARLAADVGADVVAEGVASPATAAGLAALGVELGQGRLYGYPAERLPIGQSRVDS